MMRCFPCPNRAGLGIVLLLGTLVMGVPAFGSTPQTPTFRTLEVYSPSVNRQLKVNVLLPADYGTTEKRYPVLYLLHGMKSHYGTWRTPQGIGSPGRVPRDLIVVMPDAGNFWYVNWSSDERWEDFIVDDLIPLIDRTFRTIPERRGRTLAGFSMGGFGALSIGLRHAELFHAIAGISGYLDYARAAAAELKRPAQPERRRRSRTRDIRQAVDDFRHRPDPEIQIPGFSSIAERTPEGRPFRNVDDALAHDPFHIVEHALPETLPKIYLACGTEDPLFPFSRELAQKLLELRIPFEYRQSPGGHDDTFRDDAIARFIAGRPAPIHPPESSAPPTSAAPKESP